LPEAQPGPPVVPVPELPEETPFEEPADGPEQEAEIPVPPARPVEDATGPLPPFNLAEAVRYKDKEEPGLVIIKPEPPFPLVNSKKEAEAEKNGRTEDLILAAEADELLELTELVIPTAGPIARPIAEMAEAPENALATTPEEPAETIQALDQPPAGQYAAADTPVSFLAGLAEILPESASDATPKTLDPVEDADDALSGLDEALNCLDRLARAEAVNKADLRVFNLSSLVRRLHAETVELAESRGIALSWFVSPSLDLLYKGDEKTLRLTLGHMLRGAVESARDGAIQLAVRPAPEGADLLRFSLTDSALTPDSPRPPARLLSRAWELACASQGSFSIEFVPERGTSINFSLRLKPLEDEDYIEAAQSGFRPELRRTAGPNAAPAADARPPIRRLDEMTGLAEPAAGLAGTGDLDGPLDAAVLDGVALSSPAAHPVRDSIVIADPADSGRRLIARRLGGLPYARIEAASLREAVQACSWGNVALVILDGELAADEVGQALASIEAEGAAAGRPPVPSLCLLSHMSQCERLLKAGCTACQVKSENREEFQALVQSLTTEELRSPAQFNAGPARFDSSLEEPEPSVSMLDMIVSSLDSESAELEKSGDEAPERKNNQTGGQARRAGQAEPDFGSGALTRLSGASGEYMASALVPMIPGFLDVMREDLRTLEDGVAGMKFAQVQEVTARVQSRSRTYGLSNLERMAACVERAAQAKDREAVGDLAEELALMCRRYLNSLRETHDNASK
jgi:CheY-like chemotaxis protein